MKADQVTNVYDYSSLNLLYIKIGTEKNPHAVLSEEDTVAKSLYQYTVRHNFMNYSHGGIH